MTYTWTKTTYRGPYYVDYDTDIGGPTVFPIRNATDAPPAEACGNCRFWKYTLGNMGSCNRRAPTIDAESTTARWPCVLNDAWCGEYERKRA